MLEAGINEAKKISEDRMIKLLKFSLGEIVHSWKTLM